MVDKLDAECFINNLVEIKRYRLKTRRTLFKFLRENTDKLEGDFWISRKMHYNYMGDLSDKQLIEYSELVLERINGG